MLQCEKTGCSATVVSRWLLRFTVFKVCLVPALLCRRWDKLGFWETCALNQAILVCYSMGVDVHTLAAWYRGRQA